MRQGNKVIVMMQGIVIMMRQDITQAQDAEDIHDEAMGPMAVSMICMYQK